MTKLWSWPVFDDFPPSGLAECFCAHIVIAMAEFHSECLRVSKQCS
jgi:hypothetical protein